MHYGIALLAVVLILVLRLLLTPLIGQEAPFLLFLVAVMVGAWFGGLGPGLLATLASVPAIDYFFLSPADSFSSYGAHTLTLSLFVLEGVFVSTVVAALRSARVRAETSMLEAVEHREDLRTSEERFRLLVEGVQDYAIIMLDPRGRIASWNAGAERIKGYRAQEILGEHFSCFYTREDVERGLPEEGLRVAKIEGCYKQEGLRVRKDGSTWWASVMITALKDEEGNLRGFSKVMHDITEKRETEEALRASLKELQDLKFAIDESAIVAFTDQRGGITYVNDKFLEISKYSREELLGQDHRIINSGYHSKEYMRNLWRTIAQGRVWRGELRNRAKDGSIYWVDTTIVPFLNERGKPYQYVAIRYDITERKVAEQRLQETLDRLLALYEGTQVLGSSLEREEIGSSLLETMRRTSDLYAAVIELRDDQGRLSVLHTTGSEELLRQAQSTPEAQAAQRLALESGERRSFELQQPADRDGTSLVGLALPLRVRERSMGVVKAYGSRELLEHETEETLAGLVNQAAGALENARLYGELAERERRLRDLIGRILKAQEEERRRVAYEIHDGLAQIAVAAHQHLQGFSKRHAPENPRGKEELEEALELIKQAVVEARYVISNLRPTTLDDFGLATALRLQAEELRTAEGLQVNYEETLGDKRLPEEVETVLFRVAQEALTNVRKHAQSPRVDIKLERLGQEVHLEVRDWGRGFEMSETTNGGGPGERVGLPGMQERVSLLGGKLEITSQPGAGTSVAASVWLPEEEVVHGH